MSASGKRGKKSKGTVISLQSFLADEAEPSGTTKVTKKLRNFNGDESDGEINSLPQVYQLPTGPKANRTFSDESLPHKAPFIAYLTNLPFDVDEDDIKGLFGNTSLVSIRLPKEDGETGRVRGFGYIEFENRHNLFDALTLPDPAIKGRKIRIELLNENESHFNRQRPYGRGFQGSSNNSDERESSNWRQSPSGLSRSFERGLISDNHLESVSWRAGNRSKDLHSFSKNESNTEKAPENNSASQLIVQTNFEVCTDELLCERPKLILKPRTTPLPESASNTDLEGEIGADSFVKNTEVSLKNVFGSAKPVDTAAKEREIEERLEETRSRERFNKERSQIDVTEKLSKIQIQKIEKENTNVVISWRRTNDVNVTQRRTRKHSKERKELDHASNHHKGHEEYGRKTSNLKDDGVSPISTTEPIS